MYMFTVHIAGAYDGMVQLCLRCGAVLVDNRRASWPVGDGPPVGYPPGGFVGVGAGATILMNHDAAADDEEGCEPMPTEGAKN